MNDLKMPDICAQLDRMKGLCDQLEAAQSDFTRSRDIVKRIRVEADLLADTVEALHRAAESKRSSA